MHKTLSAAVAEDDATPIDRDKPYGAREFSDWKEMSDALETELKKRKTPYTPIAW
jgi:hypothetical protein